MNYDPGSFEQPKNHSQGPEEAADPGRDASFRLLFLNKFWSSGTYPNVQNIFAAASCAAVAVPVSPVRVCHLLLVNFGHVGALICPSRAVCLKSQKDRKSKSHEVPSMPHVCTFFSNLLLEFCFLTTSFSSVILLFHVHSFDTMKISLHRSGIREW